MINSDVMFITRKKQLLYKLVLCFLVMFKTRRDIRSIYRYGENYNKYP